MDEQEKQKNRKAPRSRRLGAPRRVTMTDVARAVGCSQATVSFVLNQTSGIKISDDTRLRVIDAARALGYAAPAFAHASVEPAAAGPRLVGFVVDQLATSPEAATAIDGARQAVWDDGAVVLTAQTLGQAEMEERTIAALTACGVSALVYMTIFTRRVVLPECLMRLSIPVVLLNCYSDDLLFPSVVPSEIAGAQTGTQHLIAMGHRRIAMIIGEPWMEATQDRLKGYRRALASADIPFDPSLVEQGNWSSTSGYNATRRLLDLPVRPGAIYCQNDRMAGGCYEALKEAGLSVPGDISVLGYDDDELSRHLRPALSTSVLPHRAMGAWAMEQLAQQRSDEGVRHPITKLECSLVQRGSVARAASP